MDKQAEIARIKAEYEARNKEIDRQSRNANLRIGGGAILQGISALPIFNIPYVGTGIGGALFDAGGAIMEGASGKDIAKKAGEGFVIGETVGALPYVGKFAGKTKAGQAVGNQASKLYNYLADTKVGQKVAEIAPKVEDALMTDIKAYNPFKKTQTAYHGSPYDFNKFSNEAIGTGEGAQAHGYGHYAAINKSLGEEYREKLSPKSPEENLAIKIEDLQELKKLKNEQDIKGVSGRRTPINYDFLIKDLEKEINYLSTKYDIKNIKRNGQLYKLSIPKDDVMLREDLPISKQSKFVQDAINKINKEMGLDTYANLDAQSLKISEQIRNEYNQNNIDWAKVRELEALQEQINNKKITVAPNLTGKQYYKQIGKNSDLLSQHGIKGISYNGGIDGEARVIFNPDDIEIVRKYYNQPELWDKLKGLRPNEGAELVAIENALRNPQFPMNEQDFNAYEDLGLRYYQNIFQPNTIEIPGYGVASFSRKNRGKDDVTNFRMYPDLFELLTGAKPVNRTNYKNELDRQYDYLENPNNKIYQFLMEDIKDKGKRYKMMRNKETGK